MTMYMITKNRPTLQDVASAAAVSTATVSRALNDPDKVAKPARDRIDAAIAKLGYIPNFGARVLATNRTNILGAIIPTLSNAMFASGIQAFQEALDKDGISLLIATSNYDPEKELQQIKSLVSQGASGLLLIGNERGQDTREYLRSRRTPYVIGWCHDGDDDQTFVGFDNAIAADDAASRVIGLGHRKIGIIAGVCTYNDRARNRRDGVIAALRRHDILPLHMKECPYRIEAGRQACADMLSSANPPTAIICGNDVLAAGAMVAVRESGLNVPDDVSVIGFDDIGLASVVSPPMTTVRVPQIEMGRAAAAALLALVAGETVNDVQLDTHFIERSSLAPPKTTA